MTKLTFKHPSIEYSNWETLTVKSNTCQLKVGDVFYTDKTYWRYKPFNGLTIRGISFNGFGGTNLHFNRQDWEDARKGVACQ